MAEAGRPLISRGEPPAPMPPAPRSRRRKSATPAAPPRDTPAGVSATTSAGNPDATSTDTSDATAADISVTTPINTSHPTTSPGALGAEQDAARPARQAQRETPLDIPLDVMLAGAPAAQPATARVPKSATRREDPSATPPTRRRQLPIFGAETTDPTPADLAGLLAGPGRLDRMGGTARVRVQVDAAWRVHVLVHELVTRGLVVSWTKIENTPVNANEAGEKPARGDDRDDEAAAGDLAPGRPAEADEAELGPADIAGRDRGDVADAGDRDGDDEEDGVDVGPSEEDGVDLGPSEEDGLDLGPSDEEWVDLGRGEGHGGDLGPGEEDAGDLGARDQEDAGRRTEPDTSAIDTPGQMVTSDDRAGFGRDSVFFEVRTAYSSRLKGLATGWPAAVRRLFLDGPRLRLWVAAAGTPHGAGYALGLDPGDDPAIIDAALVRAGLQGVVSADGRYYLITGRRRLERLAELIGERPGEVPVAFWPGGAPA
jgi:hypothetical protein